MKDKSTKSLFDKVWEVVKKNILVSSTMLFVVVLIIVSIVIILITGIRDKAAERRAYEALSEEEKALLNQDFTLLKDAYEPVNEAVNKYFDALANNDQEYLQSILPDLTTNEIDNIEVRSRYIEKYDNIVCYTQAGLYEDTYYVYVTYDIIYTGFDTGLPSIVGFYYGKDEAGNYKIFKKNKMPADVLENFYIAYMQPEVQEVYNHISLSCNEKLDSDEALRDFVLNFEDVKKKDVAAIAEERERIASEERKAKEAEELLAKREIVKTTTSVNVRKSDSETSERIGTVSDGTKLTRLEEKRNGWSKVEYEGKEAYIKTEYLQVIDEAGNVVEKKDDQDQPDTNNDDNSNSNTKKYVTAKDNVNIREEADIDSARVGFAYNGDKFELVEKLSNGWTKIKYNGKDAYVKSDYVE